MRLVKPSIKFQESYDRYIKELGSEERYPFPLDFDYTDFSAYLSKVDEFSKGNNLPEGYVQSSTLWLISNDEIVGITNVRHRLNPSIERCGGHIGLSIKPSERGKNLGKALMKMSIDFLSNNLGVKTIHIHCYKNNAASSNTIKACGGVLHSEIEDNGQAVERYVALTQNRFKHQ